MYHSNIDTVKWQGRPDAYSGEYIYQIVKQLHLDQLSHSKGFCFLGFASDEGIRRNFGRIGAKDAPDIIRAQLSSLAVNKPLDLYDIGDVYCLDGDLEEAQKVLAQSIKSVIENQLVPIVLGGGHETAFGHFVGIDQALQSNKDIAIINFDAHFDLRQSINDQYGSSGTPFYQISQYLKKNDRAFHYYCAGIQPFANSKSLFEYAHANQVQYETAESINKNPYNLEFVKKIIAKHQTIYVSVCLDVFSAAIAPGVSAPQPLGISPTYVLEALQLLKQSNKVISFDIVELSPRFDLNMQTAKLAASLIHTFLLS